MVPFLFFFFLFQEVINALKKKKKNKKQKTEKQTFQSINSDCLQISEIENAFSSLDVYFLVGMQSRSHVRLSATPWTVPDGLLCAWDFPPRILEWTAAPGALPKPGVKPTAPALQLDSLLLSHQGSPLYFLTLYIMFVFFFPATLCSIQDLSSVTWDWTQGPCIGSSDFAGPSGKSHTL